MAGQALDRFNSILHRNVIDKVKFLNTSLLCGYNLPKKLICKHFLLNEVLDSPFLLPRGHKIYFYRQALPFGNEKSFNEDRITGELAYALQDTRSYNEFILTEKCVKDIKARIKYSKDLLYLHETVEELFEKFIAMKFIESWFLKDSERKIDYPII